MQKQSARIYYQGKDHKDIFYMGRYHCAMFLGEKLSWYKSLDKKNIVYIHRDFNGFATRIAIIDIKNREVSQLIHPGEDFALDKIQRSNNCILIGNRIMGQYGSFLKEYKTIGNELQSDGVIRLLDGDTIVNLSSGGIYAGKVIERTDKTVYEIEMNKIGNFEDTISKLNNISGISWVVPGCFDDYTVGKFVICIIKRYTENEEIYYFVDCENGEIVYKETAPYKTFTFGGTSFSQNKNELFRLDFDGEKRLVLSVYKDGNCDICHLSQFKESTNTTALKQKDEVLYAYVYSHYNSVSKRKLSVFTSSDWINWNIREITKFKIKIPYAQGYEYKNYTHVIISTEESAVVDGCINIRLDTFLDIMDSNSGVSYNNGEIDYSDTGMVIGNTMQGAECWSVIYIDNMMMEESEMNFACYINF